MKIYTPRKYGHPGVPFSHDLRHPVVIIGAPFDCKRREHLMMRTALTVRLVCIEFSYMLIFFSNQNAVWFVR